MPIFVDRQKVTALIDLGAQVSSVSSGFCEQMNLKVHPLDRLIVLEGTGGSAIPYLGYVEVNLQILGIKGYNEEVLLLFTPTMTYSKKALVMVGSKIIDRVMGMITKGEFVRATMTWKQSHFSVVMSGSLQLPHNGARGMGVLQRVSLCPQPQPYHDQGILSGQCPWVYPYHMEDHLTSTWDH